MKPSDLIYVMAGRPERKQYGLELYQRGFAPRLLLSVGRFEVSKMGNLQIGGMEKLLAMRDAALPHERHFFLDLSASGMCIEKAALPKWNTFGEISGLRRFLERAGALRRVMVISTDVHLRRVALTFRKVFGAAPIEFSYCAFPPAYSPCRKKAGGSVRRTGCL